MTRIIFCALLLASCAYQRPANVSPTLARDCEANFYLTRLGAGLVGFVGLNAPTGTMQEEVESCLRKEGATL